MDVVLLECLIHSNLFVTMNERWFPFNFSAVHLNESEQEEDSKLKIFLICFD